MSATGAGGSARGSGRKAGLREAAARVRVSRFEIVEPSLHDIFVRIARPDAQEAGHA